MDGGSARVTLIHIVYFAGLAADSQGNLVLRQAEQIVHTGSLPEIVRQGGTPSGRAMRQ